MAGSPFYVCPWDSDFMEALLARALEDTGGDISAAAFIFPHARPERYLSRLLRQDPRVRRPLIAPQCLTVSGLFSEFRSRVFARSAWNAGLLDRVGLLLECVRQESTDRIFAPMLADARHFFPWGLRLASLFEECFTQHRKPDNFLNTGGQVSPFAETLLARLAHIFARYRDGLLEREWTTPGFDASLATDWLREHDALPRGLFSGNMLYIAGFHALTGTEELLFRHLWRHCGARVMLHADPALIVSPAGDARSAESPGDGQARTEAHWSCRIFVEWAEKWNARLELAPEFEGRTNREGGAGCIRYYEGFDLHSQLTVLEQELADLPEPADSREVEPDREDGGESLSSLEETGRDQAADTVVVLPDSGLLMPALHHLPRTNINISMGYPLSRSPLFRLLDTLVRLQEGRRGDEYYWRDLVDLVRHPYIKMLRPQEGNPRDYPTDEAGDGRDVSEPTGSPDDGMALRRELFRLEQALYGHGRKYARPGELLEQAYLMLGREELPPRPVLAILDRLLEVCLINFENPRTPYDLAQALEGVCSLLLGHGGHLWKRFPIDAECLYRLMQSLIPELSHSQLAGERLLPQTLFALLRRLMEEERVPFEAMPLVGMQVMGMLETRLLSFRRVVILDAGEDRLPGSAAADPLLPEALRPELGLQPLHRREQTAAYHFFRLLAGAEDVVLLWQEGTDSPGIQEERKKKSRFVEELLWEEEKRLGRLLRPKDRGTGRDGPLTVLASSIVPINQERRGIAVGPEIRDLMRTLLEQPVSASLLDGYLRCPVQFFYQRLARLAPAREINEGDDPAAVGELFHQTLQDCYGQFPPGSALPGGEELAAAMGRDLIETLHASPAFAALGRTLPADSFAMLRCAGKHRLNRYLEQQPPSSILSLENLITAPFAWKGLSCSLTGKADRIDLRKFPLDEAEDGAEPAGTVQGIIILDYKTGRLPAVHPALWDNQGLWRRMEDWQPGGEGVKGSLLRELARLMESVQLPLYLLLHSLNPQNSSPPRGADGGRVPCLDAAWVALGDGGEEKMLFPSHFSQARRREIVDKSIPDLIYFLLRHMLESDQLLPHPGKHCDWCSCAKLCNVVVPF